MKVIVVKNQLEGGKIGLDLLKNQWLMVLKHWDLQQAQHQ